MEIMGLIQQFLAHTFLAEKTSCFQNMAYYNNSNLQINFYT